MKLHHKIANFFGYDLTRQRTSHASHANHLSKVLKNQRIDLVLDVGANVGQFATSLRQMGYTGQIISFEPIKQCIDTLERLSAADPLWDIVPMALGDAAGEFTINIPDSSDFASLHTLNDYSAERFPTNVANVKQEQVTVTTLEAWFQDQALGSRKIFLKLDTQGHDLDAMKGAGQILSQFRGISTELSFIPIYDSAPGHIEVLAFLQAHNFFISGIYPVSREPASLGLIEADCIAVNRQEDDI